jgi:hypothetical protein
MEKVLMQLSDLWSVVDDEDPWSQAWATVDRPGGSLHTAQPISVPGGPLSSFEHAVREFAMSRQLSCVQCNADN